MQGLLVAMMNPPADEDAFNAWYDEGTSRCDSACRASCRRGGIGRPTPRVHATDRRVCELVLDGPEWTRDAPYQLIVCMTPPEGGEDDLVAWYREEHMRMLLAVPGWPRVRLFRQVDGNGPAFMAVHELESPEVFQRPEYQASIGTPWRQRIRSSVLRYERNLFALWRPMPEMPHREVQHATSR